MNVANTLKMRGYGVQFEHDSIGEHYVALYLDDVEVKKYYCE